MPAFWAGVVAGYGIAIPVGAIAVLIVEMGLRRGLRPAFLAGAGAASADFIYAALAAIAGTAVASILIPLADELRVASGLLLFIIGLYGLWRSSSLMRNRSVAPAPARGDEAFDAPSTQQGGRTYTQFLGLTLLNPLTVTYFAALIVGGGAGELSGVGQRIAFVLGASLASLSWQSLLAVLGALGRRRLSPGLQIGLSVVGNLVVVGLGVRTLLG